DEDDLRLGAVRRGPRVVVQKLPALVDKPADACRARRFAAVDDGGFAPGEVRVGLMLDRRRPRLDERARLRDEAAVLRRAVKPDLERVGTDKSTQQQPR